MSKCTAAFLVALFCFFSVKGIASQSPEKTNKVTFTLSMDGVPAGNVVFALYGKLVPKTVNNFLQFAGDGVVENGKTLKYAGTSFHRMIEGFMLQGGDVVSGNGFGSASIYGGRFEDENFDLKHTTAGLLSMANAGPDTNGSQFFITLVPTPWLDGRHVIFGEVESGMDIVKEIERQAASPSGTPKKTVVIESSVVETY